MNSALVRFIIASGLTNLGDGIALVAWGWIATQLTRDPLLIALVPVALKAPWFVFSLPAGIIVDRVDRRRLILAADTLRALAYAAAGLTIWAALPFDAPRLHGTDRPDIFALIALCAIVVGAAEVLRDNAAQTLLPALVPEQALERANGRLWSFEFVMNNFVGTALAGVLLGLSLALPFGLNVAAMALAVALVAGLKGNFRAEPDPAGTRARNWRAELREGITYLLSHPILRQLAILTGLFNFAFEAMMVTLVLIVQERLQLGPLAISAIMAAGAVGGVSAGLVNDRIVARLGRARVLQWAMLVASVFPLTVLLTGHGPSGLVLICLGFFLLGIRRPAVEHRFGQLSPAAYPEPAAGARQFGLPVVSDRVGTAGDADRRAADPRGQYRTGTRSGAARALSAGPDHSGSNNRDLLALPWSCLCR